MSKSKIILFALLVEFLVLTVGHMAGQEAELTVSPVLLSQWDSDLKGEPLSVVDVDLPAFREMEQGAERFARRFLDFNQAEKTVLDKGQIELFHLNENANRALFLNGQQGRPLALIRREGQGKFKLASIELGYRVHENQLVPGFECSVELRNQVKGRELVDGLVFFLALNGEDLTAAEEGEAAQSPAPRLPAARGRPSARAPA